MTPNLFNALPILIERRGDHLIERSLHDVVLFSRLELESSVLQDDFKDASTIDPADIVVGERYQMTCPAEYDANTLFYTQVDLRCSSADIEKNQFTFIMENGCSELLFTGMNRYPLKNIEIDEIFQPEYDTAGNEVRRMQRVLQEGLLARNYAEAHLFDRQDTDVIRR